MDRFAHTTSLAPALSQHHSSPQEIISNLGPRPTVVDVGCFGWRFAECCERVQGRYIGVDRSPPPNQPTTAEFASMEGARLNVSSDIADFSVATHVIEHLYEPVEFIVELGRVTRPGGTIFLEAPSELSTMTRSSDDVEDHRFDSFWDDPTHVRPYTPAALYRLALSAGMRPTSIGRGNTGGIPVAYMTARVPYSGSIGSRYVTLKEVPYGFKAAAQAIWPDRLASLIEQ
ncbi:class I SAM-dependent methyltransferase [Variovorax sp. GT1P44]|uniref:class I SAM-dependent methyltransferase n=1 Tax=Variovorax sp. GT1P44 TaxID=3443742 RepID=UPI003F46223A